MDFKTKRNGIFRLNRMLNSRHIAFALCFFAAVFGASMHTQAQDTGLGIAAIVNDDVISMLDLHSRTSMVIANADMPDTTETRQRIFPQVLRGLIDEKLMLQAAHAIDIQVAQEDLKGELDRIAESNGMTIEQLTEQLLQSGVPITALSSRIEANIAWQMFVGRALSTKIKISEDEIDDEIAQIQASAGKPEYLLGEIFLPVDSPSQDNEVQQLAVRLIQQMQGGASFTAIATNFSRAPSAALGGDMGWVQESHLDLDLLNVVRQLQAGMVTRPIRTLGGYYIMMLRDIRTSPGLTSAKATMKLSQLHLAATPQSDPTQLAAQLQSMTQGMTSCEQLEAIGAQSGSPMSGSLGEVSLSVLPADMRATVASLPVGQPSAPVATGGGVAVMMVCERPDASADMKAVRDEIGQRLKLERLDIAAQRHLRDLRREAFVDIRL